MTCDGGWCGHICFSKKKLAVYLVIFMLLKRQCTEFCICIYLQAMLNQESSDLVLSENCQIAKSCNYSMLFLRIQAFTWMSCKLSFSVCVALIFLINQSINQSINPQLDIRIPSSGGRLYYTSMHVKEVQRVW